MHLLRKHYPFFLPLRSVGLSVTNLASDDGIYQLNLFTNEHERQKTKNLEICVDCIRSKYGFESIKRLSVNMDENLTSFNPKGEHVIHPVAWFK